ncbi:glycosyltransferase [Polaribacter dokdonensis]|uniref:Glycosyltransferase n=1 Tax=Polaribacter dokdonensis DSW-5 TaxID=1300348 RepID=A0A0N0CEM8_9FLAO|nr:glycosyltransferase [Polaribacter dokdonensis]KOY50658.1 Glycosyltransferase [Polaribacter dokdonensis DSW-5]SEE62347.1 Glycosyltransferase involved in cell wall bisynthesis [Polaribacter dokdonensis DSW-5]
MKINHIVNSIDKSAGGTAIYVRDLSNSLIKSNTFLKVSYNKSNVPLKFNNDVILKSYNKKQNLLNKPLEDIFHINGIWSLFLHKMVSRAKKHKIPYVVSPHGMLEDWSLSHNKLIKYLALFIYQRKDIARSSCIHVTAKSEMQSVKKLGFTNPIAIIPNGIDLTKFPIYYEKHNKHEKIKKKSFLFLSRIHPKKGLEMLIDAWSQIEHDNKEQWVIKIIGNGETEYIQSLMNRIVNKNLTDSIQILPPIFDDKLKYEAYKTADVFVLPTHSENFGIVIIEALACEIPVITTKGAPWHDLIIEKCGWWIDVGTEPLKRALLEVLNKSNFDIKKMGANGRNLVEKKYSLEIVTRKTLDMYSWILNKTEKPDFIH